MSDPIFVQSKITGGHYAFQATKANRPFENPMSIYTKIGLHESDTVADIGAYVGEYSMWAARHGAKRVLSYEPTPRTFAVLRMNRLPVMELFNMAVVGDDRKTTRLFISKGIGVTNSIMKSQGKAGAVEVEAIRYEDAVRNATVVKIDVEGAEWGYSIIQPQLRAIILEFHPIVKRPWREWAERIMSEIRSHRFKPVAEPTFRSGWDLTGCWQRGD